MRTLLAHLLMLAAALAPSGCGTVANFATLKPKVYGGIDQDEDTVIPAVLNVCNGKGKVLAIFTVCPAEFCCTFLADTATLPLTMMLDEEWRLSRVKPPAPAPTELPIAFGVNGPYLWRPVGTQPAGPPASVAPSTVEPGAS